MPKDKVSYSSLSQREAQAASSNIKDGLVLCPHCRHHRLRKIRDFQGEQKAHDYKYRFRHKYVCTGIEAWETPDGKKMFPQLNPKQWRRCKGFEATVSWKKVYGG